MESVRNGLRVTKGNHEEEEKEKRDQKKMKREIPWKENGARKSDGEATQPTIESEGKRTTYT